jgi:hypothetical protein
MYCYGTLWVPYRQALEHFLVELEGFFHSGFFQCEALKWSYFWRSLSSDVPSFKEKPHSLSVAPEPLANLEQKVGGSQTLVEKTKSLFSGYVPCIPRAYIRILFIHKEFRYRVFCHILKCPSFCGWLVVVSRWVGLMLVQSWVALCWYIPLDILFSSTVSSRAVYFPLLLSIISLNLLSLVHLFYVHRSFGL